MSPSTVPPFCSLTRMARMVPLTRPQTVTSCAMTLPSTCAPSPMRRSEARSSPLMRPKTCAGPLHSMLPTIAIPDPMQEPGPVFVVEYRVGGGSSTVVGCRLGGGSSTTECCCCNALSTASAACVAVSLSFSGTLLLNMSISVFHRHSLRKGQSCRLAIERELTQSLLLPAGRTLRLGRHVRIGLRKAECHHDGAYACEPFHLRSRVRNFASCRFVHRHRFLCLLLLCEEKLQLCAARRTLLKKLSSVVFRSQNGRERAALVSGLLHELVELDLRLRPFQ